MPNKLSQFWQELKRRKVVRVITVYAAAAFVILELLSIIIEPLRLPEWTLQFSIVFLCIGFIIAVILSWIYDIHPEGGMVKTEPADKVNAEDLGKSSNSWKIASYISFVVIVGLIVLNIIPRKQGPNIEEILDKSIAVLPFRNDSPDQERMYFINGTMEAILDNLCKIEDLRVPGRTSVEQYRDNPKPIPTVAEEMNVSYILEGSGHRDGNNIRLVVQLLDGRKDRHLWSKTYDADIEEIFSMQSEIAQLVAKEINTIITPQEKQLIEMIPTTSLTAYDYYQRGREEHRKYDFSIQNKEVLDRAEELYHYAIDNDSTFAQAYTGLAWIFWNKHYWETYFAENFLDSSLILANIALSYDDQLAEAYVVKGMYYLQFSKRDLAIEEFNQAIKLNPNHWGAYSARGVWYQESDLVEAIKNHHIAASLNRGGPGLPSILGSLSEVYESVGLMEKAKYYAQEILKLDGDSVAFYSRLSRIERTLGNYTSADELEVKGFAIDSTHINTLSSLVFINLILGKYEESLQYYERTQFELQKVAKSRIYRYGFRGGFIYMKNGLRDKADHYLNESIDILEKEKELVGPEPTAIVYYDLAAAYAFKGEKDKAYENLRIYNQKPLISLYEVSRIKVDPLFNSIHDEPEFQQIVRDMEAKFQAEHERVRQWLEVNDIL